MRPSVRRPVSKHRSANQFRRNTSRTKAKNVIPMRGGYRL
uniref:Uncharacterized protein n=1 Tax=Gokushovirinae environmental samples TaxID=1478972 RepID=A0A2R3UAE9_9VIRU|nr:hypothetical protein [Gokushovirinae environmental samples]